MKQFIKTIFISIISVVLLANYIPVQAKQSPSCECCKSSTCGCGCTQNSTSSKTVHSPDTPQGKRTCDFNKCNGNLPFNTSASVFVTSSFTESTKKLGSSIGLNIVKEDHLPFHIVSREASFYWPSFITSPRFSSELLLYPIKNLYNTYTFYPNVFLLVTTIRLK